MAPVFVRRTAVTLACFVCLALVGCEDDPAGPSETGSVSIVDFAFTPANIIVAAGGSVTWTWNGAGVEDHNVNFASASITDSALLTTGTFTATMPTTPGVYAYQCDQHPIAMTGSIEVR
jgi:plastocyanin